MTLVNDHANLMYVIKCSVIILCNKVCLMAEVNIVLKTIFDKLLSMPISL